MNASPPGFFDDGEGKGEPWPSRYEHRMMLIGGTCHVPIPMQSLLVQLQLGERAAARIEQAVPELPRGENRHGSDAARSWVSIGRSAAGAVFLYFFLKMRAGFSKAKIVCRPVQLFWKSTYELASSVVPRISKHGNEKMIVDRSGHMEDVRKFVLTNGRGRERKFWATWRFRE